MFHALEKNIENPYENLGERYVVDSKNIRKIVKFCLYGKLINRDKVFLNEKDPLI